MTVSTSSENENNTISLDSVLQDYTLEELEAMLGSREQMTLIVPYPSLGSAQSSRDLASDLLAAWFVGESIAPMCQSIAWTEQYRSPISRINFKLTSAEHSALAREIYRLAPYFSDEADDDWELDDSFMTEIDEFCQQAYERDLRLPLLGDYHMAHYISGLDEDGFSDEELEETELEGQEEKGDDGLDLLGPPSVKPPEYRYGFWRSFASRTLGYPFYASNETRNMLIAPLTADIASLLQFYDAEAFSNVQLLPATLQFALSTGGGKLIAMKVVSDTKEVLYPEAVMQYALACTDCIAMDPAPQTITACQLSKEGDALIVTTDKAHYVAFL